MLARFGNKQWQHLSAARAQRGSLREDRDCRESLVSNAS